MKATKKLASRKRRRRRRRRRDGYSLASGPASIKKIRLSDVGRSWIFKATFLVIGLAFGVIL